MPELQQTTNSPGPSGAEPKALPPGHTGGDNEPLRGERATLPELLAPAGDLDCVKAAVENGADAIYFGLDRFNARMRAANFTESDLPRLMAFLHRRGVRGYLTFNTLVFTDELPEAARFLRTIIAAGVDAAIVQDVGICRLIRRLSPDFPIHASTQMTVTSAAGIAFARDLGCNLVVLARECSLQDIERIQAATAGSLPLEVFVHGALCVAYSGQCLTSESLGGRSANRGECAQACRLPYELVSDGQTVPLGDRRYLLSPQDLASVDLLPNLARLGIASLKIEGRLKSPEYVASITRIYRQALDAMGGSEWERQRPEVAERLPIPGSPTSVSQPQTPDAKPQTPDPTYEMQMAFSRGLHTGWFRGINNQALVHARFPKKRGVFLGTVQRVSGERVQVRLEGPLKPGDGVVFDSGRPDEPEEGGRVYEIAARRLAIGDPTARPVRTQTDPPPFREVTLAFGRGDVNFTRVRPGDRVWKTSDPALERELRASFEGDRIRFRRPITIEVSGAAGLPLTVRARDEAGRVAEASSATSLASATTQPLTTERLREQLGRLGDTPFRLATIENRVSGNAMLPLSELNRLRRALVAELDRQRSAPPPWRLSEDPGTALAGRADRRAAESVSPTVQAKSRSPENSDPTPAPQLIVLVRRLDQLEAAVAAGVATIYCELEDPKRYRDAVRLTRGAAPSAAAHPSPSLFVAPPRITKPGEEWILRQVRSCEADGYLVRNYDQLEYFAGSRCVGDYSLNVANPLAAEYFVSRFGLERLTASYDLNGAQLEALLAAAPPHWFEITVHQHMPMFHMEHCVFCAFLSNGTDYTNCGRPCDRHTVQLRDRVGALHPLKADAGCRNTVFNALAQTGAAYVARFLALGARHFRVEFLDEPPEVVSRTIEMYRRLLRAELTGDQLWRELKLRHQLGVTRGALDRGERPVTVLAAAR